MQGYYILELKILVYKFLEILLVCVVYDYINFYNSCIYKKLLME